MTYKQLKDEKLIVTGTSKNNFIGIIRQEYDELTYTNLFFHIFKSNPELFCNFAKNVLKITAPLNPKTLRFVREEGNIDLLIDNDDKDNDGNKTLIVIENKIKSGINGIRHNEIGEEIGNQLCKYALYTFGKRVEKGNDKEGYTFKGFGEKEAKIKDYKNYNHRYFYIFSPKYKNFNEENINNNIKEYLKNAKYTKGTESITDEDIKSVYYHVKTYEDLLEFFENYKFEGKNKKPKYYDEFLYAIERHSYDVDNIQERRMFERLAERIEELDDKKSNDKEVNNG